MIPVYVDDWCIAEYNLKRLNKNQSVYVLLCGYGMAPELLSR